MNIKYNYKYKCKYFILEMSIYSNVTEQDLIFLRKLAEQQKNQQALKIKNKFLKQTHDVELAESLSPICKKLEEVKESTQKIGEIVILEMSIYSKVTEQDLIFLRKLAEQQKNQQALKIKIKILKQPHDVELAESLSPIYKKLEEVKESTQKIGEIVILEMSIYSNVTEQDLIILRKLAEQQKNQRALKIKNKFSKQTHDVELAESLSPITKKLEEVKDSTQKIGEIVKESTTHQLAVEKTHSALPIENEQIQPVVIYDTSLENTLSIMKNNIGFFNIVERDNGENFWK